MDKYRLIDVILIILAICLVFGIIININNYSETFDGRLNLKGLEFNTRFPDLTKIRYDYKDYPKKNNGEPVIYDYAFLRELPFDLTNIYYARINPGMIITKYGPLNYYLGYYPDVTNLKYKNRKAYCLPPIVYDLDSRNNEGVMWDQNLFYGYDYNKNYANAGPGTSDKN